MKLLKSMAAFMAFNLASANAIAGEEPDFYMKGIRQYQDWMVVASIDTFSDEMKLVAAQHKVGSHGSISVICTKGGALEINANVDNQFTNTIGGMMNFDPIVVKYKVDGNLYTSEGKYPNRLVSLGTHTHTFIAAAKAGDSMKIRTDHGSEQHTWNISLRGFTTALKQTMDVCKGLK